MHAATAAGVHPPLKGKVSREADYDFAYLDWWFVATPAVAATFGRIYDDFRIYRSALSRIAPFPDWSHFYWGFHINRRLKMRQTVRFVLYEGVDFRLARHWALGGHCMHFLGGSIPRRGGKKRAAASAVGVAVFADVAAP